MLGTNQWIGNTVGVALIGIPFYGALERGSNAASAYQDALAAGLLCLIGPILLYLAVAVRLARRGPPLAAAKASARPADY